MELRSIVSLVVCSYGTLAVRHIRWWPRGVLGVCVAAAAASRAAAGVRESKLWALQGTAGAADGLYGLLGSPGTLGGNERRWRSSGARSSPSMAAAGARVRRGS